MLRALRAYRRSSSGATSIEYGLITMVIAVACIGAWQAVGAQSRMNMRCIEQTMRFSEKSGLC
ncbi:MAG: Flp family type IVb pilin [Hyphomicrobiaceae bacterium]